MNPPCDAGGARSPSAPLWVRQRTGLREEWPRVSEHDEGAPRSPEERRDRVMELVLARGTISAREIADLFGVSIMTAHRDLDALAKTGVVRRFHGGVSAQPGSSFGA